MANTITWSSEEVEETCAEIGNAAAALNSLLKERARVELTYLIPMSGPNLDVFLASLDCFCSCMKLQVEVTSQFGGEIIIPTPARMQIRRASKKTRRDE